MLTSFKYFAQPFFILSRFSFLSFQFIIIDLSNCLAPLMQLNYNLPFIIQFLGLSILCKVRNLCTSQVTMWGKAWLPFIFLLGVLKIGIKNFILDLNRTQMFSEQLLKMTGALQRRCLPVSVIRHLREEQKSVCNYFGIQATWVSLPILPLFLHSSLNDLILFFLGL